MAARYRTEYPGEHCDQGETIGELSARVEENSRQIESLAEEIRQWRKEQGERLGALERDNYAGKVVIRVLYAVFAALAALLAWAAGKLWG